MAVSNYIYYLLQKLGAQDIRETNEGYESRCPFHHGGSRNFRVNRNGSFICHNGDCAESGSAVTLAKRALGLRYEDVLKVLKAQGIDHEHKPRLIFKPLSITDMISPYRRYPIPYLIERGYLEEDIRLYDVVFNPMSNKILFPTLDMRGRLMGLISREEGAGKPYIQERMTQKSHHIFGAYQGRQLKYDSLHIVEGHCDPLGARQVLTDSFPGAIGGCMISEVQAAIAVRHFKKHVICLDNDKEGILGTFRAIRMLRAAGSTNLAVCVYTASDPGAFPLTPDLEIQQVSVIEWMRYNKPYLDAQKRRKAKRGLYERRRI